MTLSENDKKVLAVLVDQWPEMDAFDVATACKMARTAEARGALMSLRRMGFVSSRTNPKRPTTMLYRAIPERCRELVSS